MRRLSLLMAALVICTFVFASCAAGDESYTCTFSIITQDSAVFEEREESFADGDTVADLLKKVTRREKIQLETTGIGAATYVQGIDNLYEFDDGPDSGWIYYVNEEEPSVSCGQYKIQEGDVIRWEYIVE